MGLGGADDADMVGIGKWQNEGNKCKRSPDSGSNGRLDPSEWMMMRLYAEDGGAIRSLAEEKVGNAGGGVVHARGRH